MRAVLVVVQISTKNVVENSMKIWMQDSKTTTHRLVKLNCEQHSNFTYVGDFDDNMLETFFLEIDPNINLKKNIELIKYYGYLHLFIINK